MYSVGEFAKLIKKSTRTLQSWDRKKKLIAQRTVTNRRYYTHAQYLSYLGFLPTDKSLTIVYCRVSSHKQQDDLVNQKKALEIFCQNSGNAVDEVIVDIGSGLNYKRKGFLSLLERVEKGEIKQIIVAHKDRLVRFGFEWIEHFCQQHGVKIVLMQQESLSPKEEMVKDLLSIVHTFSCRLYGLRSYKREIKNACLQKD